jgi:transcriptional regulator with XRE-family HTH domain
MACCFFMTCIKPRFKALFQLFLTHGLIQGFTMDIMQKIGERIEGLMAESGRMWDRPQLASKSGISYQGVKKLLDGGGISVDTLFTMAKVFNVSPYWLYTGDGERGTWLQAVGSTVAKLPDVAADHPLSQKAVALGLMYDTSDPDEAVRSQLFRRASAALLGFEHPASSLKSAAPGPAETPKKSAV